MATTVQIMRSISKTPPPAFMLAKKNDTIVVARHRQEERRRNQKPAQQASRFFVVVVVVGAAFLRGDPAPTELSQQGCRTKKNARNPARLESPSRHICVGHHSYVQHKRSTRRPAATKKSLECIVHLIFFGKDDEKTSKNDSKKNIRTNRRSKKPFVWLLVIVVGCCKKKS
jgi:hypothetical protein